MYCHDVLDFTKMPSFVAPLYFCFSPPLYFSALHDRLISTEMPSFPRLRQDSLFLPRRLLLLHHDIYDFTTMSFFRCTTIFLIPPRCPFFEAPRYFGCKNFLRLNWANTAVLLRDLASTVFQIYAALVASRATRR